jgi:hypothetical protein
MCRSNSGAEIYDLAWSPDGKYFITGSMDNVARIHDAQTGRRDQCGFELHSKSLTADGNRCHGSTTRRTLTLRPRRCMGSTERICRDTILRSIGPCLLIEDQGWTILFTQQSFQDGYARSQDLIK